MKAVGSAAPHRFFFVKSNARAGKSAVVAALCRRSPKMGNACLNDTHQNAIQITQEIQRLSGFRV